MDKICIAVFVIYCTYVQAVPVSNTTCGKMPKHILDCFGKPTFLIEEVASNCSEMDTECSRVKCMLRNFYVANQDRLDMSKLTEYFDQFAANNTEWADVIAHAKMHCLKEDLPPQSVFFNCEAFDVLHCSLASFIKKSKPSQWSTSSKCEESRIYAAACPVCDDKCLAADVPPGTCHSCRI